MQYKKRLSFALPLLLLTACGGGTEPPAEDATAPVAESVPPPYHVYVTNEGSR